MSQAATSARLRTPTLLQAQAIAGSLTVFAAFAAAAASGELGTAYCGFFVLALLGAVLANGRFAHKLAALWTLILAGALLVFGLQVFTGRLDIVLGAARFALLLCAHRLWNRATERDELLLMLLSLLLLCAGAALSAELLFGFAFAMFAVTGTWALALTHLRFRIEESKAEAAQAMLHSRRLITTQMLGALGGLSLIALAGAAALFFIFPRVTLGGMHRLAHPTPIAGLSDSIDLSGHGTIGEDPRVALRVRIAHEDDDGSEEISTHWRARALEIWTGRGWRARASRAKPEMPPTPFRGMKSKERKKVRWHTTDLELLAGFGEGVLLVPEGYPIGVRFPEPMSARPSERRALSNAARDLLYAPVEVGDLSYQITTAQSSATGQDRADDDATFGRREIPIPHDAELDAETPLDLDPRVRALGEKLTRGKQTAAAAQAVLEFLNDGFSYTRVLEDGAQDPIADFLFRRRAGHCELFSSSMVLLLRAGHIPARNVTGYYGGVRVSAGYYAVRAGDAHSWVEVWQAGRGWVLWDPTPASERGSKQDGLWARTLLIWDSMQARWLATVVSFDLISQGRAISAVGNILQEAGRRLSGRGTGPATRLPLLREVGPTALILILIAALIWVRRRQKLRKISKPLRGDQQRAQLLWRKTRAQLARAGVDLPDSVPAREAARRAAQRLKRAHAPLDQIVNRYSAARWGNASLGSAETSALLSRLKRALREDRA